MIALPYNSGNFYSAPRVRCLIWINLIDLLGRFAHDAGHGARVSRLRTLAAGRSGPDLDRNRYGALARPFRLLSRPRGVGTMCHRASSFGIGASKLFALQLLIHVNAFTHLNGQRKLTSLIAFPRHLNRSGAAEQSWGQHRASLEPSRPVTGLGENGKLARTDS
jgi:hypothetical protein